jgi:glycosyltransferase involved in cell wall biosynthesis
VIPVHEGAGDIDGCLASIRGEASELGATLVVVDDASTDDTGPQATRAGARVIRLDTQSGPYAARNAGWRATTEPIVVFTDVRNRATPRWLQRLVAPLSDPAVAIAGGVVDIGGDNRLAHRLARRQSHVAVEPLLGDPFLPYVTTSSMAVRRSVLETLGGFDERRSGADAELCWRAQLAGLGSVVAAGESHMTLEPRSSLRDIWRQWRRYGHSYVELRDRFADDGARPRPPAPAGHLARRLKAAAGRAVRGPRRDPMLELVDVVRWAGYELAYRRALADRGRHAP